MVDTARKLVWFALVATAACFAIFVVLGDFVSRTAQNQGPVVVRDVVTAGTHHVSGMLILPLQCDELSVETKEVSQTSYQLVFSTWQDPSVPCPQTPTPRMFQTVIFAPSVGTTFAASLDGKPFAISTVSDYSSTTTP